MTTTTCTTCTVTTPGAACFGCGAMQPFDFDAALSDAFTAFDRKAEALSDQDRQVMRLELELAQAQRVLAEDQADFDRMATELDDLTAYTGYRYDTSSYEVRTPLEYDD
jgi:hypothetical protein